MILPVLAKMEAPPADAPGRIAVPLLMDGAPGWESLVEWAMGQPQRDMIKALEQVTSIEDYTTAMVFAQPYGIEPVSADNSDLVAAELYTDLGDPPLLLAADIKYLKKLHWITLLAHVEAGRLLAEGKTDEAVEVIFDLAYFARQIADRPMFAEKLAGMQMAAQALERIRDLAYQDMLAPSHKLTAAKVKTWIGRFTGDKTYTSVASGRLLLPEGTFAGVEQLASIVTVAGQGTSEGLFAPTMARLTSMDRPWRFFSESAYWERIRPNHADGYQTQDMVKAVEADFRKRWTLNQDDAMLSTPNDFQSKIEGNPKMAALEPGFRQINELFDLRNKIRAEYVGTRLSLAVYAYKLAENQFPPGLSSVRPNYVTIIDRDTYSSDKTAVPGFYVPMRDTPKDPRGTPIPVKVKIWPAVGYPSFEVPLRDDTFVLYSVGPDGDSNSGRTLTQDDPEAEGDYLFWPPVIALVRQHLIDTGKLEESLRKSRTPQNR